jgi:chromosome partitioning protein
MIRELNSGGCRLPLCQRVVYAESAARGLAVIEAEPHSEAAREVARFAQSLMTRAKASAA